MNTIIKIYLTYLQNRLLGSTKPHPQNTDKALKIDSQPLTSPQTPKNPKDHTQDPHRLTNTWR